ncbi:MAG: hypothetical protein JJE22_03745 [Bacteroidia bacterium]|nr:hypothetical protein [Bacteroidia bacterium]
MLVDTMDHIEITNEIKKDYEKIMATTVKRLAGEYERERKKLKIDKTRTYTKHYCIKTARKNNWIIFLRKFSTKEKFELGDDVLVFLIVYYYNKTGLRVFEARSMELMVVYNGHFFTRYNERMKLNLSRPLDILIHYFKYSRHQVYKPVIKGGRNFVIGVSAAGLTLGEVQHGLKWLVNKTFISRDLLKPEQDEMEKEIITTLQTEIDKEMIAPKMNETKLLHKMENFDAIKGLPMD